MIHINAERRILSTRALQFDLHMNNRPEKFLSENDAKGSKGRCVSVSSMHGTGIHSWGVVF